MASETTATTLTGGINASYIDMLFSDYALDANVMLARSRMAPVANGTGTAAFVSTTKGSAAAVTDGTGLSNTALTQANTTVTASEVGILRHVTKKGARFHVRGEAGVHAMTMEDGRKLCLEKMETDACAQWANASTSVGTSGANLTLANLADAVSQAAINKARGPMFFALSTYQSRDARRAVIASSATILSFIGGASLMNKSDDTGYVGQFAGHPVYETNLAPAASSDKVGVFSVDGYAKPENAPTGCALGWMPEVEQVDTPQMPGKQIAVTACYGFGEISDFNYVKIVTIGS